MSEYHEIMNELGEEGHNLWLEGTESEFILVVRMNPKVFHELASDKEATMYIETHIDKGYNTLKGHPIEINSGIEDYEVVAVPITN